jgi:hypothetical protein
VRKLREIALLKRFIMLHKSASVVKQNFSSGGGSVNRLGKNGRAPAHGADYAHWYDPGLFHCGRSPPIELQNQIRQRIYAVTSQPREVARKLWAALWDFPP